MEIRQLMEKTLEEQKKQTQGILDLLKYMKLWMQQDKQYHDKTLETRRE